MKKKINPIAERRTKPSGLVLVLLLVLVLVHGQCPVFHRSLAKKEIKNPNQLKGSEVPAAFRRTQVVYE